MQTVEIKVSHMDVDLPRAKSLALAVARMVAEEPVVVSWHDKPHKQMAPRIAGADRKTRWKDYGAAFGGKLQVSVNGDYEFIFTDSSQFQTNDQRLANVEDERATSTSASRRLAPRTSCAASSTVRSRLGHGARAGQRRGAPRSCSAQARQRSASGRARNRAAPMAPPHTAH